MRVFKSFLPILWRTFPIMVAILGWSYPLQVHAKDLTSRLGVGFINEFSNSTTLRQLPAISAKYAITKDLAFLGCVGVNTQTPGGYTLGAKVFKNIFYETNLNFYVSAGAGLIKNEQAGIEFLGVFGTEVFIPGIESLGLSFEAGAALTNVTGSFVIKTVGFTFLHAGVHFYF